MVWDVLFTCGDEINFHRLAFFKECYRVNNRIGNFVTIIVDVHKFVKGLYSKICNGDVVCCSVAVIIMDSVFTTSLSLFSTPPPPHHHHHQTGLGLIKLRAEVMQEACKERPSGMLTLVGLEEDKVKQLCLECREKVPYSEICIANYLFPKGYVISGSREDINWIRDPASKLEATVKEVAVSGAFHSNLMKSAVPKLREGLSKVDIAPPKIPVFSNVTGLPYTDAEDIRNHLAEQIIRPVLWEGTVRNMIEKAKEEAGGRRMSEGGEAERRMEREGELTFVEVGPGRQLRAMLKRIDKEAFRKCVNY